MPFVDLSEKEIETIYNEVIKPLWERHLQDKGVRLPKLRKPDGKFTKDALVLVYLARGYPKTRWVTKTELTEFIRKFYPETPDVQAGRHLGMQSGFYIVSTRRGNAVIPEELKGKGAYKLLSLKEPHPSWRPKRQQAGKLDFEELKRKYGYRCVTCGSKEGEENWRYRGVITKLQKGHMNPHKPPTSDNVIPQCEQCNRADRGKWVYDKRGRVIGVAKAEVVIQSIRNGYLDKDAQIQLYEFLRKKLSEGVK